MMMSPTSQQLSIKKNSPVADTTTVQQQQTSTPSFYSDNNHDKRHSQKLHQQYYPLPTANTEANVKKQLMYTLSHTSQPYWPRTVSTKLTGGKQIEVNSSIEAMMAFKEANYQECKISAFNKNTLNKYNGLASIETILIDLDLASFEGSMQELNKAKDETLVKIYQILKRQKSAAADNNTKHHLKKPSVTVIWSGNGYHIILVIESYGKILEQFFPSKFIKLADDGELSKQFMRYLEWYLSNGKCDDKHNTTVSFGNCMLRVPGTFNAKDENRKPIKVRLVQQWDGVSKLDASVFYEQFKQHLIENAQRIKQEHKQRQQQKLSALEQLKQIPKTPQNAKVLKILKNIYKQREGTKKKARYNSDSTTIDNSPLPWIETLLSTSLRDHRKYCIWRILVPYLANKRRLSYDETFSIINTWLDKCHKLQKLDFDREDKISEAWDSAIVKEVFQISFDNPDKEPRTLKTENPKLYKILQEKGVCSN